MSGGKQRIIVAGLVVLAIILVIVQIGRGCRRRAEAERPLVRPFWCVECQKEFMAPWKSTTAKCPTCGTESSIARYYYVCKSCGERFLAFDADFTTQMAWLPGDPEGRLVYNLPASFPCPKCGSTETALERYERK
jgi:predicted RNA-binding Zn-ribbon protein involved in translation (DUF1610 family)